MCSSDLLVAARAQATAAVDPAKYVPIDAMKQLQSQVAALSSKVHGSEIDRLINQGLNDGRLLPALENWARTLGATDVAALRTYLESVQPIAALSGMQSGGKPPEAARNLSDVEVAVCKQLGLTQSEFLKSKEVTDDRHC